MKKKKKGNRNVQQQKEKTAQCSGFTFSVAGFFRTDSKLWQAFSLGTPLKCTASGVFLSRVGKPN